MKKVLFIIVSFFIVSLSSHAQEVKYLKNIKIKNIDIRIKDEESADVQPFHSLYINNKKTTLQDELVFIRNNWAIGSKNLVLLVSGCSGNMCPGLFTMLIIDGEDIMQSELFGNGHSTPDVSQINDHLLFKFPRIDRDFPSEVVEYHDGKLYGKPNDLDEFSWPKRKVETKSTELKINKLQYANDKE